MTLSKNAEDSVVEFDRVWTNNSAAAIVVTLILLSPWYVHRAAAQPGRFHLDEATIADVQRPLRGAPKQIKFLSE